MEWQSNNPLTTSHSPTNPLIPSIPSIHSMTSDPTPPPHPPWTQHHKPRSLRPLVGSAPTINPNVTQPHYLNYTCIYAIGMDALTRKTPKNMKIIFSTIMMIVTPYTMNSTPVLAQHCTQTTHIHVQKPRRLVHLEGRWTSRACQTFM